MIGKYKQYYTSSLFNIKNDINYTKKTTFVNIFTNQDIEVFNKIKEKIVIYNSEIHFFNNLDIVKKVIHNRVIIYSDNKYQSKNFQINWFSCTTDNNLLSSLIQTDQGRHIVFIEKAWFGLVWLDIAHLVLPCHFEDDLHVANYYRQIYVN